MKIRELLEKCNLDDSVEIVFIDTYGTYDLIDVTRPDNRAVTQIVCSPTNYNKKMLAIRGKIPEYLIDLIIAFTDWCANIEYGTSYTVNKELIEEFLKEYEAE